MSEPIAGTPATTADPLRVWLMAARPATLPAAVGPVLVGLGAALTVGTPFRLDTAVACLVVALLLQVVANLSNDLADFERGADTPDRLGPMRAAAAGLLTPAALRRGIAVVVVAAGLVGLYLVSVGGPILLVVGALAIVAAIAYTGGPWPYGYRGLGEVFVFVFFGLVAVVGTAYLQTRTLEPLFFAAAIPVGALVTAILVVNNLRDIPTDRAADKRTLAVMFGERFAKTEYLALLAVAAVIPVLLAVGGTVGPTVLLPLATLPLAIGPIREILATADDRDRRNLNPVLRSTARLSLVAALLFAVGLALGGS
ncbi:MAG: 1,4-dihydroxy-2-naphthoate polyprenyltransferase [Chloroflexota bacterium]